MFETKCEFPQGLKPNSQCTGSGTAEAVPLQSCRLKARTTHTRRIENPVSPIPSPYPPEAAMKSAATSSGFQSFPEYTLTTFPSLPISTVRSP